MTFETVYSIFTQFIAGKNAKKLRLWEWARVKRKPAKIKMERDLLKSGDLFCKGVAVKYGRCTSIRWYETMIEGFLAFV